MSQISKGIKIGYAVAVSPRTVAPTYIYIPDITGIPALGSSPATHDVTSLNNTSHVYIKGLTDIGGNLEFPCLFTPEVISAIDDAITAQAVPVEWVVSFPAPLSKSFFFNGEASIIYNDSIDIDAPLTGMLSITPNSDIETEVYVPQA